ncbi:hypothetical protein K458DRAFT_389456 [Lentithecium fluviatile CBS 122367]|uniref:C2H2-type domain-containing protein n=1 Tax=Lentithecium fluviatile CBS 122367 TaxID=1168545 RepID=A0A6G1J156_9PLEO|nr:hypothetical protein K458DRAFT_389456 [Lentithecium fluviatile CBS 122367]
MPHACPLCPKQFNLEWFLWEHCGGKGPSLYRPHTCGVCNKTFCNVAQLWEHCGGKDLSLTRRHTCSACGKAYCNSSHLKSHRQSLSADGIHPRIPCGTYKMEFRGREEYAKHKMTDEHRAKLDLGPKRKKTGRLVRKAVMWTDKVRAEPPSVRNTTTTTATTGPEKMNFGETLIRHTWERF